MLGKKYRISLARPAKFSQKFSKNQLVLSVGAKISQNPKFSIVVPAKFCKAAVARNRTKRLIWQSLSQLKEMIQPGIYKILVCGDLSNLTADQVLPEIKDLFGLARCLK